MGKCRFCGRPAGLLTSSHGACRRKESVRSTTFPAIQHLVETGEVTPLQTASLPIRLDENETPIWFWNNVGNLEYGTQRRYVGSSVGLSLRVAKGITLRTGGTQGAAVEEEVTRISETGLLILTNESLYYVGSRKTRKIALRDCLSFHAEDGIFSIDTRAKRHNFVPELISESRDIDKLCKTILQGSRTGEAHLPPEQTQVHALACEPAPVAKDTPPTRVWPPTGWPHRLALLHAVPTGIFAFLFMLICIPGALSFPGALSVLIWMELTVPTISLFSLITAIPALFHAEARPYARKTLLWSAIALAFGFALHVAFPFPNLVPPIGRTPQADFGPARLSPPR